MKQAFGLGILLLSALPAAAGPLEDRLAEAVRNNQTAEIKDLLAQHADPNAPQPDQSTPLAWAVDRQNEESVKLLLAAGA